MIDDVDLDRIAENFRIAKTFYDGVASGLGEGDWSSSEEVMASGFHVIEADSLPYGGTFEGVNGLAKLMVAMSSEHCSNFSFEITSRSVGENHVVTGFTISGQSEPLGEPFSHEVLEIIDIVDGKITRCRPFYWDTKEFAEKFPYAE